MKRIPPLFAGLSIIILVFAGSICHAQGNITTEPIYKFVLGCFVVLSIVLLLGFIIALWNRFKLNQSNLWVLPFIVIGLISFYVVISSTPGLIYTESDMTFETMWPHLWEK